MNARGSSGYTPLMWAAQHALKSPVAAVKTLVRLGADLRARAVTPGGSGKFKGPNALSIAARGGRLDLVKYLLEQGVPVRYGEGDDEETALHHAVVAFVNANRLEEHLAIIDLLIKELDGDVSDTLPFKFDRHTPLWIAAEHGNVEIVRHLLEKYPAIGIDEMRTTVDYLKADKSRPKQAEALALIRGTLKSRIEARDAEFLKQRAQSRPTEDAGGGGKPVLKRSLMTGSR